MSATVSRFSIISAIHCSLGVNIGFITVMPQKAALSFIFFEYMQMLVSYGTGDNEEYF